MRSTEARWKRLTEGSVRIVISPTTTGLGVVVVATGLGVVIATVLVTTALIVTAVLVVTSVLGG